ncbi:enoyl-CoA hydratase/isomerase family protein [Streptosporangium sp. NPDC004631]
MSLRTQRTDRVLRVTLDRPDQGNRLNAEVLNALTDVLAEAQSGPDPVSVVILDAAGEDFSLGRERVPGAPTNPKAITAEFELIQRTNEALGSCTAVTVAALHGRAEGAGLSLAARCDIVVAADDAVLSFPEIPHGIPPTIVLSHYRYVLPQHILGDLIFTGRELDGREAVAFGLAARHVPRAALADEVTAIADQVAGYDQASIQLVKRFLRMTTSLSPNDAPSTGIALYAVEMADRALAATSPRR